MNQVVLFSSPMRSEVSVRYAGPHSLKTILIQEGVDCRVVDFVADFTLEQLRRVVERLVTDNTIVVGISTTFGGLGSTVLKSLVDLLMSTRTKCKRFKLCIGGANARGVAINTDGVDACFEGYADDSFVDYVLSVVKAGKPTVSLSRLSNGCAIYGSSANSTRNSNGSSLVFSKNDFVQPVEALPIEMARGCIFRCKFCNYSNIGKKKLDYIREPESVKAELIRNYENHGVTVYNFLDDTYNDSVYKLDRFREMVAGLPFKIRYTGYLRADLLCRYPEMIGSLLETGLVSCYMGVETLHPEASRIIGKGWSGTEAREFMPELHHNLFGGRVNTQMGQIVGLPGEPESSILNTFDWVVDNELNAVFYSLQLNGPNQLEKSEFTKNAKKHGIVGSSAGWKSKYFTSFSAGKLAMDLNRRLAATRRVDNWTHTSLLALGFSQEELMCKPGVELAVLATSKNATMVGNYVDRIINE